jgi:hypothetical protein
MSLEGGMGGGWGAKSIPSPPSQNFRKKMAFLKKFLTFLAKKCHFFKTFWDLSGLSQICSKIFKKNLTPPPLKIFLNPYPPPKIFGQAHV